MQVRTREVKILELSNGKVPFESWLESLSPAFMRSVDARITRVRDGNFGDHKSVAEGVFELRIIQGPGLRVYYGLDGEELVILITGGNKGSQKKDVKVAHKLWKDYLNERL